MPIVNIVISGGHLSPAIAVIEELKKNRIYRLHYIGRKRALEGDRAISLEYKTVSKLKIPFYSITTGRLQREFTPFTLPSLVKVPIGFFQSLFLLAKIRPKVILSFGGYVALPVCIAAFLLRIPIIVHEQTHILGLTNRIVGRLAKIICLSWSDTKYIPQGAKTLITGNPIRLAILHPSNRNSLTNFGNKKLPILYITGGSLGARALNKTVSKILPQLVKKFRVIHQCGSAEGSKDFSMLMSIKNSLPLETKKNYLLVKHIDPEMTGDILRQSYLVICRAGANTVLEIALIGIPAILIPLPWSAESEQIQNALLLQKIGLAEIIEQKESSADKLTQLINLMQNNISYYQKNKEKAEKLFLKDGAKRIKEVIDSIINKN